MDRPGGTVLVIPTRLAARLAVECLSVSPPKKYFTRELYREMQADPDASDAGNFAAQWKRVCDGYRDHLASIRPELPPRMQAFAGTTLHDGVVRAVDRPSPSELVLDVDATGNPWGPVGVFRVRFTGVRLAEGTDNLVGDDWLYEEVHLHPQGGFDYHVLFWRSDFRVVANDVEVQQLAAAPNVN
jgi:hypothetical protein